jgi:hypothetical protein
MRALDLAWWRLSNKGGSTKKAHGKITNREVAIILSRTCWPGEISDAFFFDCRAHVEMLKR